MTGIKETAVLNVLGISTEVDNLESSEVYENLRRLKELGDVLKEHEKLLRLKAFDLAEQIGEKDEKGSFFIRFPNGEWLKKEARTSIKVKTDEAVSLLEQKGLTERLTPVLSELDAKLIYNTLKNVRPDLVHDVSFTVSDEDLEQAFYAEEITDAELQQLVERNITYALKLKPKK